ncbi:hypothetical protein JDV02_005484 [Purpureocillium takamizusanense]|uniref:Uncharacterized protein n=1 Tax=Purpureocillium takamizusanense TaxID=2060973 RepID=A0A9Q8QI55_9HYPO|nr:uncharacterized protein JDV02_005484 [Purpureocillium takamizusanense]UNI19291.1 hypothetical protein JDV02_005484 [Purpureocillium takamizusanense]
MCHQNLIFYRCKSADCAFKWFNGPEKPRPCDEVRDKFPQRPENRIGFCDGGLEVTELNFDSANMCEACQRREAFKATRRKRKESKK